MVAFLLLGACGGSRGKMMIRRTTTTPTEINVSRGDDQSWVKVRTVGKDTVVDFRGREFLFRNLKGYKGTITLDECDLRIGEAYVDIDTRTVRVKNEGRVAQLRFEGLPPGKRIVYDGGSLRLE